LDDGSLAAGLFLLNKGGLVVQSINNEEKVSKGYLDFGRMMVAELSNGVSSSAQR
jgi:hypothetical protein